MISYKNSQKSRPGFENWTFLKMSKNEKLKKVLKHCTKIDTCDVNAHKTNINVYNFVTIKNDRIYVIYFRGFFLSSYFNDK